MVDSVSFPNNTIKLGSRKSKLAVVQAEIVADHIKKRFPHLESKIISLTTLGDQVQNKPLYSFGGKSLWTRELEILLLEPIGDYEKIDLIVHSLKDMPTCLPNEFELGCIMKREDPRDALVMKSGSKYKSLKELPAGSIVGTSSVRRSSQLLKNYPHLRFQSVRGNIQTRLRKLDDPEGSFECLLLAAAGLIRVGLGDRITMALNEDIMYHAIGQGALGVETRKGDVTMQKICRLLRDDPSTYCCLAERALLAFLEGGCSVPIGCKTDFNSDTRQLTLKAIVVSCDGKEFVEGMASAEITSDKDAEKLGCSVGEKLLQNGAQGILDAINYDKIDEIKQQGITSSAN